MILPTPNESSSASSIKKNLLKNPTGQIVEVAEISGLTWLRPLQSLHKSPARNKRWTTIRRFNDDAEQPVGGSQGENGIYLRMDEDSPSSDSFL